MHWCLPALKGRVIQRRIWLNFTIFVRNVETYSSVQSSGKSHEEHENHNRVDTSMQGKVDRSYHANEVGDHLVCLLLFDFRANSQRRMRYHGRKEVSILIVVFRCVVCRLCRSWHFLTVAFL